MQQTVPGQGTVPPSWQRFRKRLTDTSWKRTKSEMHSASSNSTTEHRLHLRPLPLPLTNVMNLIPWLPPTDLVLRQLLACHPARRRVTARQLLMQHLPQLLPQATRRDRACPSRSRSRVRSRHPQTRGVKMLPITLKPISNFNPLRGYPVWMRGLSRFDQDQLDYDVLFGSTLCLRMQNTSRK